MTTLKDLKINIMALQEEVKDIRENELPHIREDLAGMKSSVKALIVINSGVAIAVIAKIIAG